MGYSLSQVPRGGVEKTAQVTFLHRDRYPLVKMAELNELASKNLDIGHGMLTLTPLGLIPRMLC
jgi:hypothetical protein